MDWNFRFSPVFIIWAQILSVGCCGAIFVGITNISDFMLIIVHFLLFLFVPLFFSFCLSFSYILIYTLNPLILSTHTHTQTCIYQQKSSS